MAFLNIPLKAIQVIISSSNGTSSMPWNNPLAYPVIPPALPPAPIQKDYRWQVVMNVEDQAHSSYLTRNPGLYNGQDIVVGQWIANLTTGQAWQIISIESKSTTQVTAIVQDVYRYNTFRDQSQVGNGSPLAGAYYVVFSVGDTGSPEIDPVPPAGTSATFSQNLISRFEYINLQYDYPLYQPGNTFVMNDVIAADSITNSFVLANATNKLVVGRVTSISDTIPGWFTINPVQKIVDNLDWLPGSVGDIIYSSTTIPGEITTTPGGSEIYIKLRDNTSSVSLSTESGPTVAGNVFQLNSVDITVSGAGLANDVVSAVNALSLSTGVTSGLVLESSSVETDSLLITGTYGEPALWASSSPATATINGVSVTFNVTSTDPGYEDYARPAQMAQVINAASIPNIVASTPSSLVLKLTNTTGGQLTFVLDTGSGLEQSATGLKISADGVTNAMLLNDFITLDADTGTGSVALGGTLNVIGTALQGVSTTTSGGDITITVADATTTTKGVASFATASFSVTAGAVTLNTVDVAHGGTGVTTLGANQVMIGNGANPVLTSSALTFVTDTLTVGGASGLSLQGDGTDAIITSLATDGDLVLLPKGTGSVVVGPVGAGLIQSDAGTALTVRGNTTLTLESGTGDTTMALPSGTGSKVTVSGPTAADYATGLADADLVNKKYVDDSIATGAAAGSIKAVTATVSLSAAGSTNVGAALPAGATVLSVKVNVTAADTATGTLVVGKAGGSQYMTASENDTQTTGLYMAECYVVEASSEQVQATVGGTPGGSGSATVIVTYKVAG